MAEYIKREAAERILDEVGAPAYAKRALILVPAADVVPVVRCGECKHLRPARHHKGENACPMWGAVGLAEYGYCHLGERKESEDEKTDN